MSATIYFADSSNEFATLSVTFEVSGTPTDPSTVSLIITDPDNNQTTCTYGGAGTITRTGTGAYSQPIGCTLAGLWQYEWVGTGACADVQPGTWTVRPVTLNRNYCSVEELKSRLQISDTADDDQLNFAVTSASRGIDRHTRRYFWQATDTRTYKPHNIWLQPVDDLVSISQLATDQAGDGTYGTIWPSANYVLTRGGEYYNQDEYGELWPWDTIRVVSVTGGTDFFFPAPYIWPWSPYSVQNRVQVTGVFGWPAVPEEVHQAALQLAVDIYKLKDAPFGVIGSSELGAVRVRANPQIAEMLFRYARHRKKVGV